MPGPRLTPSEQARALRVIRAYLRTAELGPKHGMQIVTADTRARALVRDIEERVRRERAGEGTRGERRDRD